MTFNPTITHNMARASALAYDARIEAKFKLDSQGYLSEFFDCGGTQAFVAQSDSEVIISFAGIEPSKRQDWLANVRVKQTEIRLRRYDYKGFRVHRGFYKALQQVSRPMEKLVRSVCAEGVDKIYVTGHSLGAALAQLFAFLHLERLSPQVYTFGSPRVFGRKAAKEYNYKIGGSSWRFQNHRDIVTRIPTFFRYRHAGRLCYFTADGTLIHDPGVVARVKEWFKSHSSKAMRLAGSPPDHSVDEYVRLTSELVVGREAYI